MNSEWTVVLSSDDTKQIILYNAKERQLAVKEFPMMPQSTANTVCAMCKRPFDNTPNYIYRNYFKLLAEAFEQSRNISPTSLVTGYYRQFFREGPRLGRGGGGSVYLCEHVLNGTVLGRYAVKKVAVGNNQEWLERLLKEVKVLEAGRCENVVEYKHSWLEEWQASPFTPSVPFLFILMEFAEFGSLEDLILGTEGNDDLPALFEQICTGLAHLHERNILHRDLKPSNILLAVGKGSGRFRAMISDFGEASSIESMGVRRGNTGTIEYCAPELFESSRHHSPASDIWSLGMIFYHCITRTLPFSSTDDIEQLSKEIINLQYFQTINIAV